MTCLATRALLCSFCLTPSFAAPSDLDALLKAVQSRYNRSQTLTLDFSETYAGVRRPVQKESGELYLRKPGKMLWNYTMPAGKVFISDGKDVVLYTPPDSTAQRSKLKESEDVRAPLAFLLGKLDFRKEFKSFQTRPQDGAIWITAEPKSENLAYSKVEFLAKPDGEIRQVRITEQDQSILDLTFSNEKLDVPVAQSMFVFHPPAGVQVVEAAEPQ